MHFISGPAFDSACAVTSKPFLTGNGFCVQTQYLHWDDYHKTYMTYQGDQEYVKFYETVSNETKV